MGTWYAWSIDLPREKGKEALEIIDHYGLRNILDIDGLNVSVVDEAIGVDECDKAKKALKDLALLCRGTDRDGQFFEERYEGEIDNVWILNGELVYIEILSLKKTPKGIIACIEARVDNGPEYRYEGELKEE